MTVLRGAPRGGARGAGRLRPKPARGGPVRAAAAPSPPSSPGRRDAVEGAAEGPGGRESSSTSDAPAGGAVGAGGAADRGEAVHLGWKDGLEQTWEVGPALGSGSFGEVKEASERWPVRAPGRHEMMTADGGPAPAAGGRGRLTPPPGRSRSYRGGARGRGRGAVRR